MRHHPKFAVAATMIAQTKMKRKLFATPSVQHIYDANGKRMTVDVLLRGKDSKMWKKSMSMEIGTLAKGNIHGVSATNNIEFVYKNDIPTEEKITYAQFVCDYRPLKPEPYRIRCVVGGNKLDCNIDTGSLTTNLVEFKILLNSVISDANKGAKIMSLDLKDCFLLHQ